MWRWEQIPELKHAELIKGVVYLGSPVSLAHATFDDLFHRWLVYYTDLVEGFAISPNATCLLGDDAFQPDLSLRRVGPAKLVGKYVEESPALIVEIANSSRSYDLGPKLAAYREAGVREYVAVLAEERRVEWRVLSAARYRLLQPDKDGMMRSPGLPGLWLDTTAVFPPDIKKVKAAVAQGVRPA